MIAPVLSVPFFGAGQTSARPTQSAQQGGHSFDGTWLNEKGQKNVIKGSAIHWVTGDVEPLRASGPKDFGIDNGAFTAHMSSDGHTLRWSHGFIWNRVQDGPGAARPVPSRQQQDEEKLQPRNPAMMP